MNKRIGLVFAVSIACLLNSSVWAGIETVTDRNPSDEAVFEFKFANVPSPSRGDAVEDADIFIVDGTRDRNGGDAGKLNDGKTPIYADHPAENFFFAAGTDGGRLMIDLGAVIEVVEVNTYSWHPSTRGPQVYTLYASSGESDDFNSRPKRGISPESCGWTRIARVDTRSDESEDGGQYGVNTKDSNGIIGEYRYLLFDINRTESRDPFGNTFFSEIDVIAPDSKVTTAASAMEVVRDVYNVGEDEYRLVVDTTETPDLTQWTREELAPVLKEWYPKIVEMLGSPGFTAPRRVTINFSADMRGVAATSGTQIRCAANWIRSSLEGEAKGSIVHELVHVVQQYGNARRSNPNATRPPGWLVEGIADYIRWFKFEPESHGAEIGERRIDSVGYDSSYRVSANFLDWVCRTYGEEIISRLNTALREGTYTDGLWEEVTDCTLQELDDSWKADLRK